MDNSSQNNYIMGVEFHVRYDFPWIWAISGLSVVALLLAVVCRHRKLAFLACICAPAFIILSAGAVASIWGAVLLRGMYYQDAIGKEDEYRVIFDIVHGSFGFHVTHNHYIPPNGGFYHSGNQFAALEYYTGDLERFFRLLPRGEPTFPINYSAPRKEFFNVLGFQCSYLADPVSTVHSTVPFSGAFIVPGWLVLALLAIAPTKWAVKRIRHRHPPGHCQKCGFDLRAHKPGEKCPECGTIVPAPAVKPIAGAQTPPS
jgi:hypothetical protein